MKRIIGSVIFCISLSISCSTASNDTVAGTEIGNPRNIALAVIGVRQPTLNTGKLNSAPKSLESFGGTVEVARIGLGDLKLIPGDNCQEENEAGEFSLDGPFVSDLLSGNSTPSLDDLTFNYEKYCRIKLKLKKIEASDLPQGIPESDDLVGHSFIASGHISGKAFKLTLDENEDFELRSSTGFDAPQPGQTLYLTFNIDAWFDGLNLQDIETNDQGTILIDKDNNTDLYEILKENVQLSSKLFKDGNGDGNLEDNELSDDDSLADGSD